LDADIDWINSELKSQPDNPWLYVHRAGLVAKKYYGQKSQQHVWMADLDKALQIDPNNALIHAWRSYLALCKKEEHVRSLEKVLELDPNYEPAYVYLAHAYVQHDVQKCHDVLNHARKLFPDSKGIRELCERYGAMTSL
jgi:Tfp pilus assembly protein PilF